MWVINETGSAEMVMKEVHFLVLHQCFFWLLKATGLQETPNCWLDIYKVITSSKNLKSDLAASPLLCECLLLISVRLRLIEARVETLRLLYCSPSAFSSDLTVYLSSHWHWLWLHRKVSSLSYSIISLPSPVLTQVVCRREVVSCLHFSLRPGRQLITRDIWTNDKMTQKDVVMCKKQCREEGLGCREVHSFFCLSFWLQMHLAKILTLLCL